MTMKKKAVLILYSPRELLEFLWYYCTYGKEYEWIAVCALYGKVADHQVEVCERLGIFSKVLKDDRDFMGMGMVAKLKLFLKMGVYFLTGQRQRMCRKIIREAVGDIDYELAVISCDYGILPGAFLCEAKEKKIVILEDGVGDYEKRYSYLRIRSVRNINDIAGYLLAKMGYANTAFRYTMYNTRFCMKFSLYPENLKYREYRSIEQLNNMEHPNFDKSLYQNLKDKVISTEKDYVGDAVLFTTTFYNLVKEHECVVTEVINYINKNYKGKTLILKKHPRDEHDYKFDEDVNVVQIDKNLPAELLEKRLKVSAYIYMYPSNTMLSYQKHNDKILVLYFSKLEEKSRYEFDYKGNFKKGLQVCKIMDENIILI